jgi:hypothetical protein
MYVDICFRVLEVSGSNLKQVTGCSGSFLNSLSAFRQTPEEYATLGQGRFLHTLWNIRHPINLLCTSDLLTAIKR